MSGRQSLILCHGSRLRDMWSAKGDTARCSFCQKAEDVVGRLISSTFDPNVRICDECLAVCNYILSDDAPPPASPPEPEHPGHCLMCDPRTLDLPNTIEQWVIAESAHRHSLAFPGRACRLALSIMGLHSG